MTNFMQRSVLKVKLERCPFYGSDKVKLTYDVMYGGIKGVYCSGCTGFTKFNKLINKKASAEEWRDAWNGEMKNDKG